MIHKRSFNSLFLVPFCASRRRELLRNVFTVFYGDIQDYGEQNDGLKVGMAARPCRWCCSVDDVRNSVALRLVAALAVGCIDYNLRLLASVRAAVGLLDKQRVGAVNVEVLLNGVAHFENVRGCGGVAHGSARHETKQHNE